MPFNFYKPIQIFNYLEDIFFNPFPNNKFADNNFKFDENDRKFFKLVENTVGKGEIARWERFLFFPQCFKRHILQTRKNQSLFGKRVKTLWEKRKCW